MKVFKIQLLFIILAIQYSAGKSQPFQKRGTLLSRTDSVAIVYAHIGLPAQGIGTISNLDGYFQFNWSDASNDSVSISHLSFKTIRLSIDDFMTHDSVFYMEPLSYDVPEVYILKEDSIQKILRQIFKHLPTNYPRKLHYYSAFYRNAVVDIRTGEYTSLIEADINIQDRGIRTSEDNIKIKANHFRKSDDLAHRTLLNKLFEYFRGKENKLYTLYEKSPVRAYYLNEKSLLHLLQRDLSKFYFYGKAKDYEGNIVRIGFESPTFMDFMTEFVGDVYINLDDYAILQFNVQMVYLPEYKKKHKIPYGYIMSESTQYKKVNGTYLISLIRSSEVDDHRRNENGTSLGFANQILFVNDYNLDRYKIDKIKHRMMVEKDQYINDMEEPYDPVFWVSYNMLQREPMDTKVKEDLEKKTPIEKQFKANAK